MNFEKGCYVGQETVARLFYRGKPNRRLLGLRSAAPLATGTELARDGKVVAVVRSSVVSPDLGPIALAFVRREVEVGEELDGADGGRAAVHAATPSPPGPRAGSSSTATSIRAT